MTGEPTALDQRIGSGDGSRVRFSLVKDYAGGEQRGITRPVAGSVKVAINGAEQSTGWVLEALGEVVFDVPPEAGAAITAGYLFDVPVRFADDRLEINRATFPAGEAPSVPLIEIREN